MAESQQDYRYGDDIAAAGAVTDVPVNPYSLLEAVNDASDIAHTGWLIFLGVVAYLCIAVAGITHKDLLLNTPITLPILQVNIDLIRFFLFAPIVLVFLHFGLLVQHVMLARKVLEFDAALRPLEPTPRRTHPLRLELHSYFFTQTLAGPERSLLFSTFLHLMIWLTVFTIPVLVVLYVQVTFLPYHDVDTTWSHRIALIADILVLFAMGVFLARRETRFFSAFWRQARHQPMIFVGTGIIFATALLFSFLVATVPDEWLDRAMRAMPGSTVKRSVTATVDLEPRAVFRLTAALFEGDLDPRTGRIGSPFQRNLTVTDQDLVANRDERGEVSINLRNRDLRYATLDRTDLHRADFTGSDLSGASLEGADLRSARITCTDKDAVLKKQVARDVGCTHLSGASFSGADLSGADLQLAFIARAKFDKAVLVGTDLRYSELVGADFSGADMRRAMLSGGTELMGANFLGASLQGADFTGAKLHAADFYGAGLQGAQLSFIQALGANFQGAELDAANLTSARLQAADLSDASLRGVEFASAQIWLTRLPNTTKLDAADLSQIKLKPVEGKDLEALERLIDSIAVREIRDRVSKALATLMDPTESTAWTTSSDGQGWQALKQQVGAADPAGYAAELTGILGELSCLARFSDGAVASGVARRAVASGFKGRVGDLYLKLRSGTCPAGTKLSDDQLLQLATASESASSAAAAPPPVEATTTP